MASRIAKLKENECGIDLHYRGFLLTGTGTEITEQFAKRGCSTFLTSKLDD